MGLCQDIIGGYEHVKSAWFQRAGTWASSQKWLIHTLWKRDRFREKMGPVSFPCLLPVWTFLYNILGPQVPLPFLLPVPVLFECSVKVITLSFDAPKFTPKNSVNFFLTICILAFKWCDLVLQYFTIFPHLSPRHFNVPWFAWHLFPVNTISTCTLSIYF